MAGLSRPSVTEAWTTARVTRVLEHVAVAEGNGRPTALLPDEHLRGLDDDADPVAGFQAEPLQRPVGDCRHHVAGFDVYLDLGHDRA